jgi:rhodanese-related sulfurtransferase
LSSGQTITSTSTPTYQNLTVSEAQALIEEEENLVILDVRTEGEFKSSHLPDAIVIPLSLLEERLAEVSTSKNDKILVYDSTGLRSTTACGLLTESGFTYVYNINGGIREWLFELGPVIVEASCKSCGT